MHRSEQDTSHLIFVCSDGASFWYIFNLCAWLKSCQDTLQLSSPTHLSSFIPLCRQDTYLTQHVFAGLTTTEHRIDRRIASDIKDRCTILKIIPLSTQDRRFARPRCYLLARPIWVRRASGARPGIRRVWGLIVLGTCTSHGSDATESGGE